MLRRRLPYSPRLLGTTHFSSGSGNDTCDSDGTTITFHGPVRFNDGNAAVNGSGMTIHPAQLACTVNNQTLRVKGSVNDGASAIGVKIGNSNALSTAGSKVLSIYSDDVTTEIAAIPYFGGFYLGGMTTTAINALAGADLREGQMVWDNVLHVMKVYNGTAWKTVTVS